MMPRARLYFMLAFRNNSRSPNQVLVGVLYILKSHTEMWLSLAGVLHLQGARLLNPYLPCIAAQNKIMTARRLHAAGVPIPRSWVTGNLSLLTVVAAERPLVMKPFDGR